MTTLGSLTKAVKDAAFQIGGYDADTLIEQAAARMGITVKQFNHMEAMYGTIKGYKVLLHTSNRNGKGEKVEVGTPKCSKAEYATYAEINSK